jgi:hypothetical protein
MASILPFHNLNKFALRYLNTKNTILFLFLLVKPLFSEAQDTLSAALLTADTARFESLQEMDAGNFPRRAQAALQQFSISGSYRFMVNYRELKEAYPHLLNNKNNLFVGDDSQIPQLTLNISGSPLKSVSFGTDLFMWAPMTGTGGPAENVLGLNLGISLYGSYASKYGTFNVRTGGINWFALSPFTFQTNRGYNRYSIFERNPWDPNTKALDDRYRNFYSAGGITQDMRWGQQAFQGLIVEAQNLPKRFSGSFMYGKTELNGGFSPLPNSSIGGMLKKEYGKTMKETGTNFIAFNTFNNTSYSDSTQRYHAGFNVASLSFQHTLKTVTFKGEVGGGQAVQQDTSRGWGEAISIKIGTNIAKKIPFELHLYRISPRVINNSATFINTAITEVAPNATNSSSQVVLPAVASAMVPIGQLTNNRQGIDLNTQLDFWILKNSIGYSVSGELEGISSQLTYGHPVNSLALSRFWRWGFPANVGPYENISKVYRSVYETATLNIKDPITGATITPRKYFNSIELNSKLKLKVFDKDLYIYYLGQYSSAQTFASATVVFNEKALMRTYYHQLESYLSISPNIIWCNYVGYERIVGSYETNTDAVSRRPRNQTGLGIATGFDIKLSKGAGLYVRQRWFDYKDTSFANDKYSGFETSAEVKIFF